MSTDEEYMERALTLAKKGTHTSPNPQVGAVIVKDGKILSEGYHQQAGGDHAEIVALKNCKESPIGATLYVTLEPCSHHGKTPSCIEPIISSGITKVVYASDDPNPKNQDGTKLLRDAGITVVDHVLKKEADALNKPFFKFIRTGMPYVSVKAALTVDGKIGTKTFDSRWISGEESRKWVHEKRRVVDAVMVGANTAVHDDPQLNSRIEPVRYPTRIVVGSRELPSHLKLLSLPGKNIVLSTEDRYVKNAEVIVCEEKEGNVDMTDGLKKLGERGIIHILVEGGSRLYSSLISQRLVDSFYFFIAPKLLGDDQATPVMKNQSVNLINDGIGLKFMDVQKSGEDIFIEACYDS